jgi:uncharacterized membrane protein
MNVLVELPSVVVDRPIDAVFSFISEMENGPRWDRTVRTIKESAGPVEVGTVFREWAQGEEGELEKVTVVTRCDPPTAFSYASRYESGMTEEALVSFETVEGTTRVAPVARVEIPGVAQDQEEAFAREMRSHVQALLAKLKGVLESPRSNPPAGL